MNTTCENCRRQHMEIAALTIDGHTAALCVTCQHVLTQNKERFLQLVRSKGKSESNDVMKRKHRILSALLVAGMTGIALVIGVGTAERIGGFNESPSQTEYLSFALLKQL